jgi:hypothetical protein
MEKRRSPRVPSQMQFDVFRRDRYLGRFRARDVSQGGVFLETGPAERVCSGIIELRFRAADREYRLRGVVVRREQSQGVGVQLAFWRPVDREAYAAYLDISDCRGQRPASGRVSARSAPPQELPPQFPAPPGRGDIDALGAGSLGIKTKRYD